MNSNEIAGKKFAIRETNNSYAKKPSFVQNKDGSIGILDDFNDLLISQDIMKAFGMKIKILN